MKKRKLDFVLKMDNLANAIKELKDYHCGHKQIYYNNDKNDKVIDDFKNSTHNRNKENDWTVIYPEFMNKINGQESFKNMLKSLQMYFENKVDKNVLEIFINEYKDFDKCTSIYSKEYVIEDISEFIYSTCLFGKELKTESEKEHIASQIMFCSIYCCEEILNFMVDNGVSLELEYFITLLHLMNENVFNTKPMKKIVKNTLTSNDLSAPCPEYKNEYKYAYSIIDIIYNSNKHYIFNFFTDNDMKHLMFTTLNVMTSYYVSNESSNDDSLIKQYFRKIPKKYQPHLQIILNYYVTKLWSILRDDTLDIDTKFDNFILLYKCFSVLRQLE